MFSQEDYEKLHELVFRPDYSGYKPAVIEIPNGDEKADSEKRYAHVAPKYMMTEQQRQDLMPYLERAHALALQAAGATDLRIEYYPKIEHGALRVLDYPPGAISNIHEDFDLFTLMMYRDQPDKFKSVEKYSPALDKIRSFNRQAHIGQLGEILGLGEATRHWVDPSETTQRSIVYFAIPDHELVLPDGKRVRDWLNERMARSRTEFKAYE
jgi:hypothetical protein